MWDNIIKPTVILFIICAVITGALAYVNNVTKDIIAQRTQETQEQFRKEALSEADSFVKVEREGLPDKVVGIYEAYKGNDIIGYVVDVSTKGYGGAISLTVGVNNDGQVTGVIVGDNSETPGLGAKAKEPDFIDQFKQVTLNDTLSVVKQNKKAANEIQAISGATITSRGVTEGVQAALDSVKLLTEGGN